MREIESINYRGTWWSLKKHPPKFTEDTTCICMFKDGQVTTKNMDALI